MAERDDLWQVMYDANSYNQPVPCKHFTNRQQAGWDVCAECETDWLHAAVVNYLTESGRLLPPGGEVSEETEWAVQHKLDNGNVNTSNPFYRREHAEWRTWGFHFGQQEPGVVVRRRIWAGPWSPVLSDNSEVPNGD